MEARFASKKKWDKRDELGACEGELGRSADAQGERRIGEGIGEELRNERGNEEK